jgi:hypothetical protein
MDAQLEATYEGPEAVQRRQLSVTMTTGLFLAQFDGWITDLQAIATGHPDTGAAATAAAMSLWLWSLRHTQNATDANGAKLYQSNRHGVTFPLTDALCWLIASRQQILDVVELGKAGAADPSVADELPGTLAFLSDLCHVQAARAAGETARICSELIFGYQPQPACACCGGQAPDTDTSHLQAFTHLRAQLDNSLCGFRLAKDRAANSLTGVMIPEALDYPL